jgi:hypothetical protein
MDYRKGSIMNKKMTFVATGDTFITRRLADKSEQYTALISLIQSAEVRFTNLEITTHHFEGFPGAASGGTWAIAPPELLQANRDFWIRHREELLRMQQHRRWIKHGLPASSVRI